MSFHKNYILQDYIKNKYLDLVVGDIESTKAIIDLFKVLLEKLKPEIEKL